MLTQVRSRLPGQPEAADPPTARDEPAKQFTLLGNKLQAMSIPEAQGLASRILELGATRDETQRRRGLFGCLASLDEGIGQGSPTGWRLTAADELLRIARSVPQCEVLGEQLLNRPIGDVVTLITVVEIDKGTSAPDRPVVSRIIQPGFSLLNETGDREAVVRARVRSSP